jgi:uncharacterized RmlC-like cupin family protein
VNRDRADDWRNNGVKVIPSSALDINTAQTPGMNRAAAITQARTGANKLWAGTVRIDANAEAGPGDFIYVPPFVPHQEINASTSKPLNCVLVRSGHEPVVVNLDIAPAEPPEDVPWVDPIHPRP